MWYVEKYTGTHWEIDSVESSRGRAMEVLKYKLKMYPEYKWRVSEAICKDIYNTMEKK